MSLENPKTDGVTTINYVVMSILNRMKDYSMRNYSFLEQIIIEGFTELNLWHLDSVEVVYLRVNEETKKVDLPSDFVDYVRIGVPISGKLRVLTRHDKILFPREFADGEEVGNTDATTTIPSTLEYFAPHFRNGQFIGGLYGYPGGVDAAYYRVDREKRTIIFSGDVDSNEIVLEYISSGIKTSGSTVIPLEAVPALRAYGIWHEKESDPKVSVSAKERYKNLYDQEVEALRFFQSAFTMDEYKKHVYKHTHQAMKR